MIVSTRKIDDIKHALENSNVDFPRGGVLQGIAGKALFYYYAGKYMDYGEGYDGFYNSHLLQCKELFTSDYQSEYYFMELAEYGKMLCYLQHMSESDPHTNNIYGQIDAKLSKRFDECLLAGNYDPHNGAVAIGNYFLDRSLEDPASGKLLQYMTGRLAAVFSADEVSRIELPIVNGYTVKNYLGISHGIAGVLMFFVNALESPLVTTERPICEKACEHLINYIISHQHSFEEMGCCFPDKLDHSPYRTPLYLTYGDLGIGYALYRAAESMKRKELKITALEVLGTCCLRQALNEESKIQHAGLETGSAGLMALFLHLFRMTGQLEFQQAATFWEEKTLHFGERDVDFSIAGFEFVFNQNVPHNNYCFTGGIIGIGMALIHAGAAHSDSQFLKFYNFR